MTCESDSCADEQADRHHLEAVGLDRDDAVVEHPGPAPGAEHERQVGPVDVGVDDSDVGAGLGERQGEIHGDGGLADAALARRHGDRVLDLGNHVRGALGRGRRGGLRVALRAVLMRVSRGRGAAAHLRADLRHAGQPPDELGRHAVDHHLRLRRLGREREREADRAALDGDVAHEPQRDDVFLALGILDTAERIDDVLLARHTDE